MAPDLRLGAAAAALVAAGVLLAGCGGGGGSGGGPTPSPSPTPGPEPIACPENLKRAHCSKCANTTDSEIICKACSGGYELNEQPNSSDLYCTFNCSAFEPKPRPAKPLDVQQYLGVEWPAVCIGESVSKFFTIGDWGGVCGWGNQNICKNGTKAALCCGGSSCGDPGMPCPMPNRGGGHYNQEIDGVAQRLVAERMRDRARVLKEAGTPARYIVNVGDNFYPGGIDVHCGLGDKSSILTQFAQMWKDMYTGDLHDLEWWSVLGNHDYGGVCYIKGWDQQIYYTWHDDKWVLPAQYWKRTVQYENFKAEFFLTDGNIYDTNTDANHNMCGARSNPGIHCEQSNYPGDGGHCANSGGLDSIGTCKGWFAKLWAGNHKWLQEEVPKSDADWQIVVNHYPAFYPLGSGASHMDWSKFLEPMGIDLMITGHTHEQRIYQGYQGGSYDMGATAWVITGGGGGVTAEYHPHVDGKGADYSYGFMEVSISLHELNITSWSHGGRAGNINIVNRTTVKPVQRKTMEELIDLGLVPRMEHVNQSDAMYFREHVNQSDAMYF